MRNREPPRQETPLLYFAYGSNMLTRRLRSRVPSAVPVGPAVLAGHALSFTKLSLDGSGKATIHEQPGSDVYGVLFEIPRTELSGLERAEEAYSARHVSVQLADRREVSRALTYVGDRIRAGLRPYSWYLELVVAGAQEHRLPEGYLHALRETSSLPDPDARRASLHLDALGAC